MFQYIFSEHPRLLYFSFSNAHSKLRCIHEHSNLLTVEIKENDRDVHFHRHRRNPESQISSVKKLLESRRREPTTHEDVSKYDHRQCKMQWG